MCTRPRALHRPLSRVAAPLLLSVLLAATPLLLALAPTGAPAQEKTALRPSVPGVRGLTTSGHPLASMAGMQILLQGGNAADASVAVLSTLNVVRPQMSGAGGNGFMTIYDKVSGRVHSLAATGAAPMGLDRAARSPEELAKGIHAGAVPGLFGGWIALLDRFGTMSLAQVLAPALEYAENGHPIEESVTGSIEDGRELFERYESSRRVFLPLGRVPKPGETVRMTDLANTFRKVIEAERLALEAGKTRSQALRAAFDRFYTGDIAEEMARFYRENGGDFTMADFAAYEPIWGEPVHTTYRGYDVYSSPPTSRGGLEVTMQLNLVEGFDLAGMGHNTPESLHLMAEAIKVAKADIYHYVADPKLVDVPVRELLSKEYAATRRALIDPASAKTYPAAGDPITLAPLLSEGAQPAAVGDGSDRSREGSTDSFSVTDRWGNVVVCTPTHGSMFGTGVVVGNTGLTFNNGTRLGSTSPYPEDVNYAKGGQIPILNNSPIVVLRDGRFYMSLGTPGGETIGQTQFQALVNVLDFGMTIQEAMEAPRFALSGDPNFYVPGAEVAFQVENRVPEGVLEALRRRGHDVQAVGGWRFGSMQGILVDFETGAITAGADPRRVAYAIGW